MNRAMIDKRVQISLTFILALNVLVWFSMRHTQAQWGNVPPPPNPKLAASYGLGDKSFSYRINGIMLQNLGDTGGKFTPLKDYDFKRLTKWFFLQDDLDPKSNYVPYLASYYFGGVQEPEKYRPVFDYLEKVGMRDYGEKWRWMVQAVYIARHSLKDLDKALELAYKLAETENTDAPNWVKQMPAFVMTKRGDKQAAYDLMVEILKTSAEKMHPNEVNAIVANICEVILEPHEAQQDPLCNSDM